MEEKAEIPASKTETGAPGLTSTRTLRHKVLCARASLPPRNWRSSSRRALMTALVVRNLSALPYEPAHTAQQLVMWYAGGCGPCGAATCSALYRAGYRLRHAAIQLEP